MSKSLKLIIESLLFASPKPLTVKDIRDCLPDTDSKDIKNALTILEHDFEAMERSFSLKAVAGGYQFRTSPVYGSYILKMLQSTPNRLSRAAMETLAIIAYKQPILRHEIEKLRGVDVGGILKTLLEKGLIKIMGRKELPGKPLIYGTTRRFLEVFDLKDISDLPSIKEIKDFGLSDYQPTPLNQDNLQHPREIEAEPHRETAPEMQEDQDQQATLEETGQNQEMVPDTMTEDVQHQEDEPIRDQASDSMEGHWEDWPGEASEEDEDNYQESPSDDMPDEEYLFPESEGIQEEYRDMNGDNLPEDDLSEDGNGDGPKD